jgi:lipopolysaccharide/colanic/teichoic acid biosynthesis glycosyltransferase
MLSRWDELPPQLRTEQVRPYWEYLDIRRPQLALKRCFDAAASAAALTVLGLPMLLIAVCVRLDSPGPVLFRQERVTKDMRRFRIHKFRTMVTDAERLGSTVTAAGDSRVTKVGAVLRRTKLDELPQLLDVLRGDMSLVGTRPEAPKYVDHYSSEYMATLLLPAGVTSEASVRFLREEELLREVKDMDEVYLREILPEKMKWNLSSLAQFSVWTDLRTLGRTVLAIFKR